MALETRFAKRKLSTPKVQTATQKKMVSPKKTARISFDEYNNMIQVKAYELYTKRNPYEGDHLSDWVKAEDLVKKNLVKNGINIA